MDLTPIDAALWTVSVAGQVFLLFVLIRHRLYRTFPIFTAYITYSIASDILFSFLSRHTSQNSYFIAYFANNVPEFLLQLGILLEVAKNVLSPVKRSLPPAAYYLFAGIVAVATFSALFLSVHSESGELSHWSQYFVQVNFSVAILRLVIFSAIAFFSQMLGIGWKNHVLQIASGFAGYSIAILLVEFLHRLTGVGDDYVYHLHEQLRIFGWCVALGYWSYVLAKIEAPRKEFSPKMANFLVSISAVGRGDR